MSATEPVTDPRSLIRELRASYVNLPGLWRVTGGIPEGVALRRTDEEPIEETDLPPSLLSLLQHYRDGHPNVQLSLEKYVRRVNGSPVLVREDERALPDEDELVTFSVTTAINASDIAEVVSDLLVARRHSQS